MATAVWSCVVALTIGCGGGVAPERPAGALAATSAGYPSGPMTIIAPASPGGGWDQTARQIQQVLAEVGVLGVPVDVVNRAVPAARSGYPTLSRGIATTRIR